MKLKEELIEIFRDEKVLAASANLSYREEYIKDSIDIQKNEIYKSILKTGYTDSEKDDFIESLDLHLNQPDWVGSFVIYLEDGHMELICDLDWGCFRFNKIEYRKIPDNLKGERNE